MLSVAPYKNWNILFTHLVTSVLGLTPTYIQRKPNTPKNSVTTLFPNTTQNRVIKTIAIDTIEAFRIRLGGCFRILWGLQSLKLNTSPLKIGHRPGPLKGSSIFQPLIFRAILLRFREAKCWLSKMYGSVDVKWPPWRMLTDSKPMETMQPA